MPVSRAGVTQLVECNLAKVDVASSSLVTRSLFILHLPMWGHVHLTILCLCGSTGPGGLKTAVFRLQSAKWGWPVFCVLGGEILQHSSLLHGTPYRARSALTLVRIPAIIE